MGNLRSTEKRHFTDQDVVGIDPLNGLQQPMMTSNENCNLTIQNLKVRDYPLILKLSPVTEPSVAESPLITYLIVTFIVLVIIAVFIIIAYRKIWNKR